MKILLPFPAIVILGVLAVASCSSTPALYCDEGQPCTAGHPVCDLQGICESSGFITNTCIPEACWDAGEPPVIDAGIIDAPVDADPSAPDAAPPPDAEVSNGMVAVASGTFSMGCASGDPYCTTGPFRDRELPAHQVTLSAFMIDQTEVAQEDYQACIAASACTAPSTNFSPTSRKPVTNVSWQQAQAYCTWKGRRLPTEAEWEFAARGTDSRIYPWGNNDPDCSFVNFGTCEPIGLVDVDSLAGGASPVGALNMAGNVAEWVADWYSETYYQNSPSADPTGPVSGTEKVHRGGDRGTSSAGLRTSLRLTATPTTQTFIIGFRCAL